MNPFLDIVRVGFFCSVTCALVTNNTTSILPPLVCFLLFETGFWFLLLKNKRSNQADYTIFFASRQAWSTI